jgi:hypothetical protein
VTDTSPARNSALDHLASQRQAVRAVNALRRAGVACLLLKGISHERWLYSDGARLVSRDVDLIVPCSQLDVASEAIMRLGMRPYRDEVGPRRHRLDLLFMPSDQTGVPVELHTSFHFLTATPERCWALLSTDSDSIEIGGTRIDVPSVPARALLLSLHAAAHGRSGAWAIEDLRRAIGVVPLDSWRHAATLSKELGASAAFSGGLRMLQAGDEIADALGLAEPDDPALMLSLQSSPRPAIPMVKYAYGRPLAAVARLLKSELIPPSDQMRTWYPMARRGRRGLAAAHATRLARLALQTPQLLVSWRQAREVMRR